MATGTVSFTIASVNDAPVAVDDVRTSPEDAAFAIAGSALATNDTDVDGDSLAVGSATNATNGTVSISGSTVTFTPTANYNGPASFDYTISDGTASDSGTVNLTITAVNDAPEAFDDAVTTAEDVPVGIRVFLNDLDIDNDPLSVGTTTQPAHGTLTIAGGMITYTPTLNYSGPDSFTYNAADGAGGVDTGLVTINVTAVNDAPAAAADTSTVAEDSSVLVNVLANDTDVESPVSLTGIGLQPAHGIATITNGQITYTPAANYFGPDTFAYLVSDGTGGVGGAMVSINVTPVNDAPVGFADAYELTEQITVPVATGLLSNDTDIDSMNLTAVLVDPPYYGTLTLRPDGSFDYTADEFCAFSDNFTYRVNDGFLDSELVTVNLTLNHRPSADYNFYSVTADQSLVVLAPGVLGNDDDFDGDPLTATLASAPSHFSAFNLNSDGSFTYTPEPGFVNMEDHFTYIVSDGKSSSIGDVYIYVYPGQGSGGSGCGTACAPGAPDDNGALVVRPDIRALEDARADRQIAGFQCCLIAIDNLDTNVSFGGKGCDALGLTYDADNIGTLDYISQ
jgi:hypothetical protein